MATIDPSDPTQALRKNGEPKSDAHRLRDAVLDWRNLLAVFLPLVLVVAVFVGVRALNTLEGFEGLVARQDCLDDLEARFEIALVDSSTTRLAVQDATTPEGREEAQRIFQEALVRLEGARADYTKRDVLCPPPATRRR